MNMKKICFALLAAVLAFASCTEEPKYVAEAKLEIVKSNLVLPCEGGEGYVILEDGTGVTVETGVSWLSSSVNGNTVIFTATANESIESRYASVSITSPNGTATVTAQQMGALSVSFSPSDINTGCKAARFTFPYEYSTKIEASASVSWITAQTTDKELIVALSENTAADSRTGEVRWKLGDVSGVIKVTQRGTAGGNFTENPNWVPSYSGRTTYQGQQVDVFSVEVKDNGASGSYLVALCDESVYLSSGCASQAEFLETFAQASIDDLKDYIAQNPGQTMDDFTYTVSVQEAWSVLPDGKYFVYAIGVDASGNPSGLFAYAPFTIGGGGESGDLNVNQNWNIAYNGRYTQQGTEYEYFTFTAPTSDTYYPIVVEASQFQTQYGGSVANIASSFADYLKSNQVAPLSGTQELLFQKKEAGDYIALMIGIDTRWNLTSYYARKDVTISDEPAQPGSEAYNKWLGTWTLTAKNVAGTADSTYFDFTVAQNSADKSYRVNGWGGSKFVDFGDVLALFDATSGELVLQSYNVAEGVDLYEDKRLWDIGIYGDILYQGSYVPVNGDNVKLATGKLSSDGSKATLSGSEVKLNDGSTFTFAHIWWYGFSQDGRNYVSYKGTRPLFPCSLTKKAGAATASILNVEPETVSAFTARKALKAPAQRIHSIR